MPRYHQAHRSLERAFENKPHLKIALRQCLNLLFDLVLQHQFHDRSFRELEAIMQDWYVRMNNAESRLIRRMFGLESRPSIE